MTAKVSELTQAPTKPARQRLIDAGERLFAEHGWNGVGIGTIAAAADVSLAALNYNFGEKENLLAKIFAERARPIAAERMGLLTEIKASGTVTLERVIEAFLRPAFGAGSEEMFGGKVFARLRARLATEPEAFGRRILANALNEPSRHYIAALHTLLPELSAEDLGRRFHFLLSAMVYTMPMLAGLSLSPMDRAIQAMCRPSCCTSCHSWPPDFGLRHYPSPFAANRERR